MPSERRAPQRRISRVVGAYGAAEGRRRRRGRAEGETVA